MTRPALTVVVLAGNEAETIEKCLKSCRFADEIVVVLANSSDTTKTIIRDLFPETKIIETHDEYNKNFSRWRNLGLKTATSDWILYVDADEQVSPTLSSEILESIKLPSPSAYYAIPRQNYFLGQRVRHGGTFPDYVKRLFYRPLFRGYQGILHEEPIVDGSFGYLKNPLLHFTHRHLESMVAKTLAWTDLQAQHLFDVHHPQIYWWRFPRMFIWKLWQRLINQHFFLDGPVGVLSSIFEAFDTFIVYARLWELQQHDQTRSHL